MTATSDGIGQRSQRGPGCGEPPGRSWASTCPTTTRAVLPGRLGAEDRRWVEALGGRGARHERACRDLHAILLRAARFEVAQRRGAHRVSGADVEDIACQAASD